MALLVLDAIVSISLPLAYLSIQLSCKPNLQVNVRYLAFCMQLSLHLQYGDYDVNALPRRYPELCLTAVWDQQFSVWETFTDAKYLLKSCPELFKLCMLFKCFWILRSLSKLRSQSDWSELYWISDPCVNHVPVRHAYFQQVQAAGYKQQHAKSINYSLAENVCLGLARTAACTALKRHTPSPKQKQLSLKSVSHQVGLFLQSMFLF